MNGQADGSARGDRPVVLVRTLDPAATLPAYARDGDAGADLACIEERTLAPGERALVRTGIAVAIPDGWVGLVHPRSGLAAKHGITIVNAPGTVDAGYRGEILVNLLNTDPRESFTITPGDRIAQLVLQEVARAHFTAADSLPESSRGETGHGSTGGFGTSAT
ncbi:Deoxyuridine 5'-triphosphate nucleotidohydrolase [Nostocoides australiense Ben110]|uniref:Deoxyuridine 5'-triphosphate nucleotidohydrolase n=1 Tax=Nostocoides australiense Ben110 TaxID=1193182 RepID=W6JXY8_9MICO|nr:Deoxyuridine 5'-triphosphate nucleotidohydrolase [Tetrasphaera australiensis Ben110]